MLQWILGSLWNSTANTVKSGAESVQNQTRILTGRVYDAATQPSPEKQMQVLEDYKKNRDVIKARHEERKAAHNARCAQDNQEQALELSKWKAKIDSSLRIVKNEITALNESYTPLLWHFKLKTKCAEKDALLALSAASTMAELQLFAEQQKKNPDITIDPETGIGGLLEKIINSKDGAGLAKEGKSGLLVKSS